MNLNDLPTSIECGDGCESPHFLTINRDSDGKWCIGYVEFVDHTACAFINSADTVQEGATRMYYSLKRNNFI